MDNNIEYNIGDVVEVWMSMDRTQVRWIEVDQIEDDVKNGLPGFAGVAVYDTTAPAPFRAWCYDARITRVVAPLGYELAVLEQL